ncbi:MAG: TetR family transcriptional regulator [Rhodospirillales bacterium]|nr:MAG: TetR family transcriptional regulator [Rhodospirillales bacterium]
MPTASDPADRLVAAARQLLPARGWRRLTLAEVAAEAGVSLLDAYQTFPTKADLLAGFIVQTDRHALAGGPAELTEPVRDRLFEVVMRRFDALVPHKPAVAAVLRDLPADPLTALLVAPRFATAMAWLLEAAGLSSSGLTGAVRVKGLALIYLTTLHTWLDDDSADMARTMAHLDQALRRSEMVVRLLPGMADTAPATAPGPAAFPAPPESP